MYIVTLSEGLEAYFDNKVKEYIGKFGDEHISMYSRLYADVPNMYLKRIFSIFHYHFNSLFKYLNNRRSNGHYTAHESRELLYLIDELKTIHSNAFNSEYRFGINTYYKGKIEECEEFLSETNGSPIPHEFQKINLIDIHPLFTLEQTVSIARVGNKVSFSTRPIGEGSYASVHKYKDDFYNRFFVIKKAFKDLKEEEYKRFKIEFEVMKKLKSPYVIEVYNFNEEKHEYIMEYADETLDSYISKNNAKLEVYERTGLVRQICRAFVYINGKGVLHRDISTKNILIKQYEGLNVIKVSDFGLVKREESTLTNKNTEMKGSLNDPKLEIIGFSNYEIKHETYALTRLIYFVMTGKSRLNSYPSQEFELFIKKGIADSIDNRYKNVQELLDAFNNSVNSLNKSV